MACMVLSEVAATAATRAFAASWPSAAGRYANSSRR